MYRNDLPRTGIMYSAPFPTLAAAEQDSPSNLGPTGIGDVPEELADWLVVSADPRGWTYGNDDAEAMDETNFAAICDAVTLDADLGIPWIRCDYRMGGRIADQGWVVTGIDDALEAGVAHYGRTLIVAPWNVDAIDAAESCERTLSDYPLLDDEAYSEREFAAWCDYAPLAFGDELRYAPLDNETSDAIADQVEDLLPLLSRHLDYYYGFSGDYFPPFLEILASAIPA